MKCPRCGGTKIHISVPVESMWYYYIEDNKIYKTHAEGWSRMGDIFITCEDCSQDEDAGETEYKCTKEQEHEVKGILLAARSADVTEFMEKDFDWELPDGKEKKL